MSQRPGKYYGSIRCNSAISKSSLPGLDYTINPYLGCEHGCIYCYVPDVLRRKEIVDGWGYRTYGKENIASALAKQIHGLRPGVVGFSTVTDAYQPYESRMCLARPLIEQLLKHRFKISFQTKSSLILRDSDLIRGENVEVGFTITSLDRRFSRTFEPYASTPGERVKALEEFSSKGVRTWIFYGPIIAGYNDDEDTIREITALARRTGSRLLYDRLRLKPLLSKRLSDLLGDKKMAELTEIERGKHMNNVFSKIIRIGKESGVVVEPAFP
ncbi:MAG: radical SAM protein [Nitrososphaeria archaeon]